MQSTKAKGSSRIAIKQISAKNNISIQKRSIFTLQQQNCQKELNSVEFSINKVSFRSNELKHKKLQEIQSKCVQWTSKQLDLLTELCIQNGFAWSIIAKNFSNKSQYYLKNYFHNQFRKTTNFLHQFSVKHLHDKIKTITPKLLIPIIDLGNQIIKMVQSLGLKINQESNLFVFRKNIFEICFNKQKFSYDQVLQIVKLIKKISLRMRSYGIFKVKSRKQWKLSVQTLKTLCQKDPLILEWDLKKQSVELSTQSYKKSFNQPIPDLSEVANSCYQQQIEDCLINDFHISKSELQHNHMHFDKQFDNMLGIKINSDNQIDRLGLKF